MGNPIKKTIQLNWMVFFIGFYDFFNQSDIILKPQKSGKFLIP
jgi:hypothetical protein